MSRKIEEAERKVSIEDVLKSEREKEEGNNFVKLKDFPNALDSYNRAISLNPSNAILYCNRSWIFYNEGDFARVIEDCTRSISLKDDYIRAYQRRGKAYLNMKQYSQALKDYTKVLEAEPDDPDTYSDFKFCNSILSKENKEKKQESALKIAEKQESGPKITLVIPDHIFQDDSQMYDSLELVGNALQSSYVHLESAGNYQKAGRYNEAIQESQQALDCVTSVLAKSVGVIHKAKSDIYMVIGSCYFKKQEFRLAIEYFTILQSLELSDLNGKVQALVHRGFAYEIMNNYEEACNDMSEILRIQPKNKQAMEFMEKYQSIISNKRVYAKATESEFKIFLKKIEEIKEKGNGYFKKNELKMAIEDFSLGIKEISHKFSEAVIIHDPELLKIYVMLYNNRALLHFKQDRFDSAIHDSLFVLRFDRNNAKALFRSAKCYEKCNNFSDALRVISMAMRIDSDNSVFRQDYNHYLKEIEKMKASSSGYTKDIEEMKVVSEENDSGRENTGFKTKQNEVEERKEGNKAKEEPKVMEEQRKVSVGSTIVSTEVKDEVKKSIKEIEHEQKMEESKIIESKPPKVNQKLRSINQTSNATAKKYEMPQPIPTSSSMLLNACRSLTDPILFYNYLKVLST